MKNTSLAEKVTLPNCITALRIAGTVCLVFTAPLSLIFYIIYTFCGLSDVLDGWIARATNSTSEFGSRLDSIADLLFYAVMLIKLLPALWRMLPTWIWYVVGGILLLRISSYITVAVKFRRFAAVHTRLNKLTGAAVFLIPYFMLLPGMAVYSLVVCGIAVAAAVQELLLHLGRDEYRVNHKALF